MSSTSGNLSFDAQRNGDAADTGRAPVRVQSSANPIRQVENREWWLWGFAVTVTLLLTAAILSLTFPEAPLSKDYLYSQTLREWVRGLAALVLLFDIYTVYQHLQLQRIRRKLAERERLFHLITENAADMIAVVNRRGVRLYNSPSYERILGYTKEDLAHTSSLEQVHPEDRARVLEAAEKAYQTGIGKSLEYRIRHKDGSWRILESTSSAIGGDDPDSGGLVIVSRDITQRKRAEALLEHRALHDGLTNLPNRTLFLDRLQRAINVSQRHRDFKFAVLFIDIDEFRVFNDSMGHAAGDELLVQISRRLTACLRGNDTVCYGPGQNEEPSAGVDTLARPGGDEFAVLATELRDPSDAVRVASRIQERLAPPFSLNGQEIVISASVGIVFGKGGQSNAEDVLRDAEIAMHRAKRAGKAHCEVFDGAMQLDAVKRLKLETELRKALELNEFRVYYQPLVSLQNGEIVGFEALTRWQTPQGVVMPGEFIAVADETGLILPMNEQLLRDGCVQLRQWHQKFIAGSPLKLSVNVTAKQFAQPELASQIREILRETHTDPGCIDLEITENIAMADAAHSAIVFSQLKALGVHLSIDDFGTGYSSLSRLQRFPVDILKIDRTFISGLDSDRDTREIVRIIIILARNLNMRVTAEGIERPEQMEILRELGCELGQGYLWSKPEKAEIAEQLLEKQHVRDGKGSGLLKRASSTQG